MYTIVLNKLAPKTCTKAPMSEPDPLKRAELRLQEVDKLKLRKFVNPEDIVQGQSKLNFGASRSSELPISEPLTPLCARQPSWPTSSPR